MMRCLVGAVIALSLLLGGHHGRAQVPAVCAERQTIADALAGHYGETPAAVGLTADGLLMEVFASPSGSFTIVLTRPDGLSCVLLTGEGWRHLAVNPPGRQA